MTQPKPGQIWQHQKHDPDNPAKWHEYRVVMLSITSKYLASDQHKIFYAVDTETEAKLQVVATQQMVSDERGDYLQDTGNCYLFDGNKQIRKPYILYQNIVPEVDSALWARPLENFMSDRNNEPRFRLVE